MDAETKEEKLLTFGRPQVVRNPQQDTLTSTANPLNERWEGGGSWVHPFWSGACDTPE